MSPQPVSKRPQRGGLRGGTRACWIRSKRAVWGWVVVLICLLVRGVAGEGATGCDPAEPLPTEEAVRQGLAQRLEAGDGQQALFLERYRHVLIRVREERNKAGKLREVEETRTVHDPTASEAGDSEEGVEAGQGRSYRERDVSIDREVLERFDFQVEGREELEGRTVLRVLFRPRSGHLPKHNLVDRFINLIAGTLWLDEPSMALVRARMRLLEPVDLWGGIAGMVYSLEMAYDRACTPDGLWYTRRGVWEVDYRKFLKRSLVESEERCEEVEPVISQ